MPREEYDYLTDATREVLTDNVKPIAGGWNKCFQYIYGILQGEKKDPFAPFLSFYRGVLKGGVSTAPWDRELAHERQRYSGESPGREVCEAITDKFSGNNKLLEKYLAAIQDGKLSLAELDELEPLVEIEEGMIAVLKKAMAAHRIKLESR